MARKKETRRKPALGRKKTLGRARPAKRKKILERVKTPRRRRVPSRKEKIPAGAPLILVWLKEQKIGLRDVALVTACLVLFIVIALGWDMMSSGDRLIAGLGLASGILMVIGALVSR